ncbi:hypothetical protein [Mycetocola sp. 2940]|uniref:hypothetical protein n=1 Tax=Mycetocola sp. 2940 TaxID=3156452 RepID=UPI0033988C78
MFLTLRRLTIKRMLRGGDDEGVALIAVIGIMAVLAVVALSIATAAISSATFTSGTRGNVQARAAADAGIDAAWAGMTKGTFFCTVPQADGLTYETTVEYFDAAGPIACTGTSSLAGTPVRAVVTSVGTAEHAGISSGADGSQRTVAALFDIVVDPGDFKLDDAVFSDGSFALTNAFDVLDLSGHSNANIYSNGSVSCGARVPTVEGWILAQGDFNGLNTCSIDGSVWVGGSVNVSSDVSITGDVFSAGGTGPSPTGIAIGKVFIGGTVVANGNVTTTTKDNQGRCALSGSAARVCGSIISIDGTVSLNDGTVVGGGIYARGNIDIGKAETDRAIGGSIVSSHGGLSGTLRNGIATGIGGFVAVNGASSIPKSNIGNPSSSCAASSGFSLCNPSNPVFPIAHVPSELNFPTNTRVVAPPRESLPRVNMYPDAGLASKWPGWTIQHVACDAVKSTIAAGWTGKLLLIADGCIAPIQWKTSTPGESPIVLPGDLAIMNPSGFDTQADVQVKSSTAGVEHTMMWIVPSDAKLPAGTDLATWTAPFLTDPDYTKPTCNAGGSFGNVSISTKLNLVDTKWFIYTPCEIAMSTHLTGFKGQMYAGVTKLPSESVFEFAKLEVPGATAAPTSTSLVDVTPTARFDVRGGG